MGTDLEHNRKTKQTLAMSALPTSHQPDTMGEEIGDMSESEALTPPTPKEATREDISHDRQKTMPTKEAEDENDDAMQKQEHNANQQPGSIEQELERFLEEEQRTIMGESDKKGVETSAEQHPDKTDAVTQDQNKLTDPNRTP